MMETIHTLSPQHVNFTRATGRLWEVPMDYGLFFKQDTLEARIQQCYMEERNYDLCIDKNEEAAVIERQRHWA